MPAGSCSGALPEALLGQHSVPGAGISGSIIYIKGCIIVIIMEMVAAAGCCRLLLLLVHLAQPSIDGLIMDDAAAG